MICKVSPGNERKSNILNLISVLGWKNLTIVGNHFWCLNNLKNAHFSNYFCNCENG